MHVMPSGLDLEATCTPEGMARLVKVIIDTWVQRENLYLGGGEARSAACCLSNEFLTAACQLGQA